MSRRRRWILLPLAALAASLILIVALFDWNWFKGPIEDAASAALGRDIEIAALNVDLSTTPTITLEQVRIANAGWGSRPHLLTVPQVELALRLWPLLTGRIELPFLRVREPDLLLERNQEGEANWQFGQPDQPAGAPPLPAIEDLQIAGATIRYHEPNRPQDLVAALETVDGAITSTGIQLSADGMLDQEPLSLRLASAPVERLEAEADRFPFELDARLGSTRLAATGSAEQPLQAQGLSVEIAVDSADPGTLLALAGREPPDLEHLELTFSLTRQDQIWSLRQLDLQLGESDLSGDVLFSSQGEQPAISADLSSEQVRLAVVRDVIALVTESSGGAPQRPGVEAALADAQAALRNGAPDDSSAGASDLGLSSAMLPDIDAEVSYTVDRFFGPDLALTDLDLDARLRDGLPRLKLTGGGDYQDTPVALDIQLGPAEQAPSAERAYPVQARIEAAATQVQIDGVIGQPETLDGLDVEVQASSEDLNRALAIADLDLPQIPPFAISGHVVQDGQVWRIADLYGQFSESDLAGEVTVDLSEARPFITTDLRSNRLLVSDMITAGEKAAAIEGRVDESQPSEEEKEPAVISARGINFDALPEIDANVAFTGEFVDVQEFRLDRLRLALKVRDQIAMLDASGDGQFRDGPLSFEAHAGTERNLEDPDARYPLDFALETERTEIVLDGTVAQPGLLAGLQVDLSLSGPNLDRLGEILQLSLPTTPPFELQSHLTHDENRWSLSGLNGTIGDSDIQGDATIVLGGGRPTLKAELMSDRLDFDDLGLLVGAPGDADETLSAAQERAAAEEAAIRGVLPDEPFDVPELRSMDARVSYRAKQVQAPNLPLEGVVLDLILEDGRLTLEPLRFDVADGALDSVIRLDGRTDMLAGNLELKVRNVRLDRLLSEFDIDIAEIELEKEGVGTFGGRAELAIRGNSIQDLAGSADGEVALIMDGGRINAFIVEGIGLDVGEAIALLLFGEEEQQSEMVPIQCFVGRFDVHDGVMQAKALVLETSDSTVTGKGRIDLGEERLSLEFLAHPKDASALSASTPVRIEGTFENPRVDLISEDLREKSLAALALGVVLPAIGAIIPFFEEGETGDTNCARLIRAASAADPGEPAAEQSN